MQRIEQPTMEQMMRRKANLERKQRQRAREKARSHQAIQEHLEKVKGDQMNAEGIASVEHYAGASQAEQTARSAEAAREHQTWLRTKASPLDLRAEARERGR
jgi:hypothetical protein